MLKNATVHPNIVLNELCPPHVNIGLALIGSSRTLRFEWDWEQGEYIMVEYPPIEISDEYSSRSWDWEIQSDFFKSNNIIPHWFIYNSTLRMSQMIFYNYLDYSPLRKIVHDEALNKHLDASSVIENDPYHWISRKPDKLPLFWNLLYLFTWRLWILTFAAILLVFLFMKFSSSIYKNFNERVITTELVLIPIRYQKLYIYRNTLFKFCF